MKADQGIKIFIIILSIILALVLFCKEEYIFSLIFLLVPLLALESYRLSEFVITENSVIWKFYNNWIAEATKTPPDQIRVERIKIDNGEVIVGLSKGSVVRFLVEVKEAFGEQTTIELLDGEILTNYLISIPAWLTGTLEDTSNSSTLSGDLARLKIRVKSKNKEKIFGPLVTLM